MISIQALLTLGPTFIFLIFYFPKTFWIFVFISFDYFCSFVAFRFFFSFLSSRVSEVKSIPLVSIRLGFEYEWLIKENI